MNILTKQCSFLLLSGILFSLKSLAVYNNPLTPIYTRAEKPNGIYEELQGSRIAISNMPAYKTQDDLGECRAFSVATIIQKYTCDTWKKDIPDCKNPPSDSAISYFGMLAYTNQVPGQKNTFQVNQTSARNMYDIIKGISESGNKLILESCKPFDKLVNNFSTSGQEGLSKRDNFFKYLKSIYENKKSETEANIADCPECLAQINNNTGLNADLASLKKALVKPSYDKFLYSLFFEGCKMEAFPVGFSIQAYPVDSVDANPTDIKSKIIEGLKKNKPVLFPSLCLAQETGGDCTLTHSIVISGYKKVCAQDNKNICKDVFKVHNSWGEEWQKLNNDGWVDADLLTQNTVKVKTGDKYRIGSSAVIWLE